MNLGISTACFYPMYLEQAIEHLIAHEVKTMELFVNTFSETQRDFYCSLKHRIEDGGVRLLSLHPFTSLLESILFFSEYDRRFEDGIEFYKQTYFDMMNQLEIPLMVFHGAKIENKCSEELYFEHYAALRQAGKEYGIHIAQENVAHCRSRSLDFLCRMKEYLHDDVSFVLDVKQAVQGGEDPIEMVQTLGKQIVHTHLSDHGQKTDHPQWDCLPVGEGQFDFARFFSVLKEQGGCSSGVIELYHDSYKNYEQIYHSLKELEKYQ
ncbi:MAG: sugar phosphate isomerase/epimerase family protein [Massiliimalia sp.]|jgi:sugar phosphate isomerase/epimerase